MVRLDDNHRSTPQVVAAASAALGPSVAAVPPRSTAPDGPLPVVTAYEDETAEAEGVAAALARPVGRGDALVGPGRPGPHPRPAVRGTPGSGPGRHPPPDRARPRAADGPGVRQRRGPDRRRPAGWRPGHDAVELATFHRAKGLEWTSVCVVGLEDGFVPIVYAESARPATRSAGCSMWP